MELSGQKYKAILGLLINAAKLFERLYSAYIPAMHETGTYFYLGRFNSS